jgi:5-methylcytosine-specific restriction endonuclease McrA
LARIRTIKPEFFTSEDIVSMSPLARLFYVSLWCEADREGRMEWKPVTFKMRYLPGDACDVSELAKELMARGLIVLYSADGRQYAEIPTFTEHQVINNRESDSSIPARTTENTSKVPAGVNLTPELRATIIARDGSRCGRCPATEDLTVDHIFPQSMGGTHNPKNLRCLCRRCNSARPVAGEALIADLKRDGYTLNDMAKLCFDAPSRVKAASARVKAEGKEGKGKEGREYAVSAGFDTFWKTWPAHERKQDRKACWLKWEALGLESIAGAIASDVEAKKATQKWRDGFVELPETYLNNRRWEDGGSEDSTPWHESRSGIERKAEELGLSPWNEIDEQWGPFRARVLKAAEQAERQAA